MADLEVIKSLGEGESIAMMMMMMMMINIMMMRLLKLGATKIFMNIDIWERTFLHAYKFSFVNESVLPQGIF